VKRRITIAVIAIGSAFIASYALAWFSVGSQVPRNTRVLGVEIGGQSRLAAANILNQHFSTALNKPISFDVLGKIRDVKPTEIGAAFDAGGTLSKVAKRAVNPFDLFARAFTKVDIQPVVTVDRDLFVKTIDKLDKRSKIAIREGGIAFKGVVPVAIWPVEGRSIDKSKALQQFKSQWLRSSPIKLSILVERPRVSAKEVSRAVQSVAYPSVKESITLVIDDKECLLAPKDLASAMTFVPDTQGRLVAHFSSDLMSHSVGAAWYRIVTPAKDAIFKFIDGHPRIYPSELGHSVSDDALTLALNPVLTETGVARRASVSTDIEQPRITTEEAGGLGITGEITKYTTFYPPAAYRIQNIHRAADLIDGTIVKPGDVFSLNKTVGERTAANGFAEGIVIYDGHFEKDLGGGVSQVATTTLNAAWYSGLEIVAHMAHSFYISRYPAGREATVAWPNVDLRFRNDTDHSILVHATYTKSSLTVAIYGTRKYTVETITGPQRNITDFATYSDDGPTCISQGGVRGFDIDVTRVLKLADVEVTRTAFHTHYLPEDRITCTNPLAVFGNPAIKTPPKPKPKPKATPTPTPTPTDTPSVSATPSATALP